MHLSPDLFLSDPDTQMDTGFMVEQWGPLAAISDAGSRTGGLACNGTAPAVNNDTAQVSQNMTTKVHHY